MELTLDGCFMLVLTDEYMSVYDRVNYKFVRHIHLEDIDADEESNRLYLIDDDRYAIRTDDGIKVFDFKG